MEPPCLGWAILAPRQHFPSWKGKAALFKKFGEVDAWPVCLDTKDTEEIISIVKAIAPVYGGINLEDISAPRCFEIEERLREELDIPVFHDDQHGTADRHPRGTDQRVASGRQEDRGCAHRRVGSGCCGIPPSSGSLKLHGATDVIGCGRNGALGPFREEKVTRTGTGSHRIRTHAVLKVA